MDRLSKYLACILLTICKRIGVAWLVITWISAVELVGAVCCRPRHHVRLHVSLLGNSYLIQVAVACISSFFTESPFLYTESTGIPLKAAAHLEVLGLVVPMGGCPGGSIYLLLPPAK